MALIKCKECGKEFSSNADSCPNCGNPNVVEKDVVIKKEVKVDIKEKKAKWSTVRLIIGIISMVLFFLISIQSCAVGLSNTIQDSEATSGTAGIGCAFFTLIAGIVCVATRNSKGKGDAIAAIILYWFASLLTIDTGDTYGDLPIWGRIAFCFGLINLGSILASTNYFKEKNKSKILSGAVICLSFIIFISAFFSGSSTDGNKSNELINATDNNSSSSKIKVESTKDKIFKPDETFKFDDLEITIGNDISLVKVKNSYSEHKGKEVVKIPITIKNNKEESHHLNMFDYKVFGSKGTEIDDLDYLFDNSLSDAGDLRSGASYTKYMYYIYDGDGKYAIEFDDWSNKVIVEFEISKQ